MKPTCPYIINASKIAHKKDLLPKEKVVECEYERECNKVDCLKLENPNYRTLYLRQMGVNNEVSPKNKLYARIEKYFQINQEMRRERG